MKEIPLDLAVQPWSTFGSYYALQAMGSWNGDPEGLYFKSLYQGEAKSRIVRILDRTRSGDQMVAVTANPVEIAVKDTKCSGSLSVTSAAPHAFRFRGFGNCFELEFVCPTEMVQLGPQAWAVNCPSQGLKTVVRVERGRAAASMDWNGDNATRISVTLEAEAEARFEGSIAFYYASSFGPIEGFDSYEDCKERLTKQLEEWTASPPTVSGEFQEALFRTDVVHWSAFVHPGGNYKRPTMLASTNGMVGIWSWDHCFHAMSLLKRQPQLAWDQLMIPFDHQDIRGCLPDALTSAKVHWGSTKPPVHGWALGWMLDHGLEMTEDRFRQIYGPLSRWTDYWFEHRDRNKTGLPEYFNGNDSGWDNNTTFSEGSPVRSPDLATYLILQMETLARLAQWSGDLDSQAHWESRSRLLLDRLLDEFWLEDRFVARLSESGKPVYSDSLILSIPLMLGRRLPWTVQQGLVSGLRREGRFLSPFGLATEAQSSRYFAQDSYWRGPVWAPPMLMIVLGLEDVGEEAFAVDLAQRFCRCVASQGGWENFDPVSGRGQRDSTILWTSAVFQILAQWLAAR